MCFTVQCAVIVTVQSRYMVICALLTHYNICGTSVCESMLIDLCLYQKRFVICHAEKSF